MKKFIVLDGNALVHRCFHALPPLATKEGVIVNAVYGFLTVLFKMVKELKPEYVAVCFDRAEKTFRHDMYKEYKATREKKGDDLYNQFPILQDVLKKMGIVCIDKAGFEADDLLGTIAELNKKEKDIQTLIVTGDLDTLQLVDGDKTLVYTFKKGISDSMVYDEAAVKERFGVTPKQMIDYKALRGDPSDNIKGVKGVGEKTAAQLIQEFGSIEKMYEDLDISSVVTNRIKTLLRAAEKDAIFCKILVTIKCDVPIEYHLEDCRLKPIDRAALAELFSKLQFTTLMNRVPAIFFEAAPTPKEEKNTPVVCETVKAKDLTEFKDAKSVALFFLPDPCEVWKTAYTGVSVCTEEGKSTFVSLKESWPKELVALLTDSKMEKIIHDAKQVVLAGLIQGIHIQGLLFDTMVAAYVLNPGTRAHDLSKLVFTELGHELMELPEETKPGAEFACERAEYLWKLAAFFKKELEEKELNSVYSEMEEPLISILAAMEYQGIEIDVTFLNKLSKKHATEIDRLQKEIYALAGSEFNISSPLQLKEVLFEKMNLSQAGLKKIKTGISTAAPQLEKLKELHPIIEKILEYREYTKLKSTYIDAIPLLVNPKTHRVHAHFNQTVAATGRLSSSDPNLQNIPIKSPLGEEIRKGFVAKKGYSFVELDYSQIELRIMAHVSDDAQMIQDFNEGKDIHTSTASKIYGIDMKDVTSTMRREAKAVNFGILFGMGYIGLAQSANISKEKAKKFIEKYFELYPGIAEYIRKSQEDASEKGYAETLFKRRRYLPELYSDMPQMKAGALRMAMNMPIQGTEADILKLAMIQISKKLPTISKDTQMLIQVHDSLLFEVPDKEIKKVSEFLKEEMNAIIKLKVPLVVNIEAGKNWGEMEEVK